MEPDIREKPTTVLVGLCIETCLAANETAALWQAFMPRRHEIESRCANTLYSVQLFPPELSLAEFTATTPFRKWAAVPVSKAGSLPPAMQQLVIPAGLYAVFAHKGSADQAQPVMQWIFREWLPRSNYTLDARPQFEIMGEDYRPQDPQAREDIWIPVAAARN